MMNEESISVEAVSDNYRTSTESFVEERGLKVVSLVKGLVNNSL